MRKTCSPFLPIAFLSLVSLSQAGEEIAVKLDLKVPMKDGVRLSTNLFLPREEGSFPAILMRTPYGKGDARNGGARAYAKAGYAYVVQDTRGRGGSEGAFDPFMHETEDGSATIDWVRSQPWSNGKIGMTGGSYVGFVQWQAASRGPGSLKAICPAVTFSDFHDDVAYVGGAFQLALALGWATGVSQVPGEDLMGRDWTAILRTLPLMDYSRLLGRRIGFYDRWIEHPSDGEYWSRASVKGSYRSIGAATLNLGNWYDIFAQATTENFRRMREEAPSEDVRRAQKLIMGPGAHGPPASRLGERDFGEAAKLDLGSLERRWFDRWLKGEENGILEEAPVRIFVMGIDRWRDENEWPLARARSASFYLRGGGKANTLHGDGALSTTAPGDEPADRFVYDPLDPVPTTGGANLVLIPSGPFDQRKVEERPDVLVYTSAPLEEPLEVTGPVRMELFASSSAPDTDFTAKLVDVFPDGKAWNLTDGIIRARYRDSDSRPQLLEPGEVYRFTIDLWVTSNVFLNGHRIRLEVSSSNFPRFDRNPNTGGTFAQEGAVLRAEQTVHHSARHPSRLILPVIPGKASGKPEVRRF